jgi:hypothetical protein
MVDVFSADEHEVLVKQLKGKGETPMAEELARVVDWALETRIRATLLEYILEGKLRVLFNEEGTAVFCTDDRLFSSFEEIQEEFGD